MKQNKIFLLKKDPNKNTEDNWISMTGKEFWAFLQTLEGKERVRRFVRLHACSVDDVIYYVESNDPCAKEIRKEQDHEQYLSRQESQSEFKTVVDDFDPDETSLWERIPDETYDLESIVEERLEKQWLHKAIKHLPKEEQDLMNAYLRSDKFSEKAYGRLHGMTRDEVHTLKQRAIRHLRKLRGYPI